METEHVERSVDEQPSDVEHDLPSRPRQVYDMRVKGETFRSIASALGISVGTAHNDMKRAVAALECRTGDVVVEVATENARLNTWYSRIEAAFTTGEPIDGQLEKAARLAVLISKERRELLGLNAPKRLAVSADDSPAATPNRALFAALHEAVTDHEQRTRDLDAELDEATA